MAIHVFVKQLACAFIAIIMYNIMLSYDIIENFSLLKAKFIYIFFYLLVHAPALRLLKLNLFFTYFVQAKTHAISFFFIR